MEEQVVEFYTDPTPVTRFSASQPARERKMNGRHRSTSPQWGSIVYSVGGQAELLTASGTTWLNPKPNIISNLLVLVVFGCIKTFFQAFFAFFSPGNPANDTLPG